MDMRETEAESHFRQEATGWLAGHLPEGWTESRMREPTDERARVRFRHDWHRALHAGGWIGLTWPREYGGRGLPLTYQLIFNEEFVRAGAPPIASWVGLELLGPTLMVHGSEAQKRAYLRPILTGEHLWCQGFSEPGAGSDLFATSTRAERTGTGWRLAGRKIWTSWAQYADFALVLARTGPAEARHKSLSTFVVPMGARGLTVVPTRMIDGESEENELVLDGVEIGPEALVGAENAGATVVMTNMGFARGIGTIQRTLVLELALHRLWRTADLLPGRVGSAYQREHARRRLAHLRARIAALKYLGYRKVAEMEGGGGPGAIASVEKLAWSDGYGALAGLAIEILGPRALVEDLDLHDGTWPGQWLKEYFRSKGAAIEGGTDAIQRNTIARRVLDLAPT